MIRTHLVGLAFADTATGRSVMLSAVQDSIGLLLPPNQVLYPAAFNTLADVRLTCRRIGFETDVIFRANPGSPANWQLNPATSRLEVWHELLEFPEPQVTEHTGPDNIIDQTLRFEASARMGPGIAFTLGAPVNRATAAKVAKTIVREDGRVFLVESVAYPVIRNELDALPPMQAALPREANTRVALVKALPKLEALHAVRPLQRAAREQQLAFNAARGLAIDYSLLTGGCPGRS